ncbi:MAG: hypothetical protein L0215_24755 [Gemmataceae bacterium]|nr:hypothetical protein [Gemmataceae bacterium]
MFESEDGEDLSWFLAHEDRLTLLRPQQLVHTSQDSQHFSRFAEVIASGAGTISIAGTDLKLVLFICGENNALDGMRKASVLKASANPDGPEPLSRVLSGNWVILNPSHWPYFPQIKITGFAKVGVVHSERGDAGPTLKRLVENPGTFRDGTSSPLGIIHVNNYLDDEPKTEPFSDISFGNCIRRVEGPLAGTSRGIAAWRSSVYEIEAHRQTE